MEQDSPTPLCFVGPKGTGKTLVIAHFASENKIPIIQYDCSENTRKGDLIGRYILRGDETEYQLGVLPTAIELANEAGKAILVLEELNALAPNMQKQLNQLLDWRRHVFADNGKTFPYTVATNLPNNGSAQFTVPNNENTNLGRFMLKAHDNYFFDLAHGRFTIQGAGAVTNNNLDNLKIYPNPAKQNVRISFNAKNLQQPVQIGLFDLSGKQILNKTYEPAAQFNQNINIEKIAKGIYFIKIKNGENNTAQKLIIK